MPIVRVPDGRQVRFPDDMPREQIKAFIMEKFPENKSVEQRQPLTPEQRAETRKQGSELLKDIGISTSGWGVAGDAAKGFGKGVLGGAERIAGGATFGISDWVGDKLGTGVKERRQELEELSPAIKYANIGTELVGGGLTGGGLYKGVAKGLGAIPKVGKAAQYLAPTVTGAVSGGLYSGFENDSINSGLIGAGIGGAMGGALDLAGRGLSKAWSAASKVKNTPRGFENAVGTKEGARTLNRAVRESDKIAEQVYSKAPEALETLNRQAMDKLDDAVRGVDVKGQMAGAKKAYGDYIDTNKAKKIINNSRLDIKGLTENQQNWLNQAWTAGKKNTLEKAGSLGHLDEMSKELNKMVKGSRVANPAGVGTVATPETVALQGLKDKVDDVIEKAGLQNIKAQYRQAKSLEDAFNRGLKYSPTDVKTRNLTFNNPDERSAFAQGLVEKIKMNPESNNIAGKTRNLRGALRKALGDKADGVFKDIDNIDKSYKNAERILSIAEKKIITPEPQTGKVGLLREFFESLGSIGGGTVDFARRWGTAKSAERAAQYLLNPNLKVRKPLFDILQPYLPTSAAITQSDIMKGEY